MKKDRDSAKPKEVKRLEQLTFIMEHWDELPDRIQGRFEGTVTAARDFLDDSPDTKATG